MKRDGIINRHKVGAILTVYMDTVYVDGSTHATEGFQGAHERYVVAVKGKDSMHDICGME